MARRGATLSRPSGNGRILAVGEIEIAGNRMTQRRQVGGSPLMLWFLDAGDDETIGTLSWPASKKRQGTKSREVGHRLGSGRYGDLMLTGEPKIVRWASRQA